MIRQCMQKLLLGMAFESARALRMVLVVMFVRNDHNIHNVGEVALLQSFEDAANHGVCGGNGLTNLCAVPKEGIKKLGSVTPKIVRLARPGESVGSVPNQEVSKP